MAACEYAADVARTEAERRLTFEMLELAEKICDEIIATGQPIDAPPEKP